MKQLSNRVLNLPESATLKMSRLANELKAKGNDVISLSLGEPDFDTPNHIKEAAYQALLDGFTKYTPVPGLPQLRNAIIDKFKKENNLTFTMDQIVVSNGAKQSINNLCQALINPGDEVVLFTPYWVSYIDIIKLSGGYAIELMADISQDYKVSANQLRGALNERVKFILFSNPCNPTGSFYSQSELEALADVMRDFPDVLIISDEIYEYINFDHDHYSFAQIEGMKERTIIVNGFSKGFAMTGWRLGYMAAPTPIAKACSKIQSQSTSGASSFGQIAGAHALAGHREDAKKMKDAYKRRRDIMFNGLNEIIGVKANYPHGAFYIFPDISGLFGKSHNGNEVKNSGDLAEYLLAEAHVAVVSGAAFGAPKCIRLSFVASDEALKVALERIKKAINQLS